ncbi:conserved hypothetical protein [Ricinus communis]|uniref:Uncharacterized protein n=1 Tax=Ricinus communis TaxID=3988 RepID=B9S3H5_RICCO|nr:conserved hypothetical protein [Ricinus communis]
MEMNKTSARSTKNYSSKVIDRDMICIYINGYCFLKTEVTVIIVVADEVAEGVDDSNITVILTLANHML